MYLRRIFISKQYLPCIWVVLLLFQKDTCSDLSSHSFFQIYCVFAEQELYQGDTNNNYNTSSVLGMHILKVVCIMTTSFPAIHFFNDSIRIPREDLKNPHAKEILFILQHFLQLSIIITAPWLIREKVEDYVYFRKTIAALLFQMCLFIPQNQLQ